MLLISFSLLRLRGAVLYLARDMSAEEFVKKDFRCPLRLLILLAKRMMLDVKLTDDFNPPFCQH